ncbi:OstA-like protein [Daejeonella lutea]|uniref:OstA-like protein n=1 Tax=Daejeonella lutea TaxID=572036 RepID=A0A1T5CV69_9SPHI|nr:OstA-like protein [Daejeonella lutea]SKB63349.1 OstA-like protein [Daejeonella lutea]
MRKIIFSVLLSVLSLAAVAQGTKIQLRSSLKTKGFQKEGFARVIGPVFEHDGSTLAADSADVNFESNVFDAFGHVVITQPSGTVIYADLLNYNGGTKLAILTNNVRMIDKDAVLTTPLLTYNMGTKVGTYTGGGKIVNGNNVLTSKNGYYFESTRDAYFRYNVVLTSPDALIKTDTLRYNASSKIAYFYGPTNIYGKDDTLYTENGTYNTSNDQARFGKKNLYTQGSKSLKGDSLFYDRKAGFGRAIGNITFIDTAEKAELRGGVGLYRKSDESILVTKNPYVVIITQSDSSKVDSIWYTADTLFSKVVFTRDVLPYKKDELKTDTELSAPDPVAVVKPPATNLPSSTDTLARPPALQDTSKRVVPVGVDKKAAPPPDAKNKTTTLTSKNNNSKSAPAKKTPVPPIKGGKVAAEPVQTAKADSIPGDTARNRIVIAYHNAKIFKSDLQARADSMFFSYSDSTVRCYFNPILWAQGSQLTGDTIYLQMKNKKLNNMLLQHNSFIVNSEDADSTTFNQIKGKVITGYFKDNKLNQLFVDGNAESVYYVKDDSAYVGLNHQVSSRIKMNFADGKLQGINFIRAVQASTKPMDKLTEEDKILKGFIWKPKDRPKSKEEIIPQLAKKESSPKSPVKTQPVKTAPSKTVPAKTVPVKKPVPVASATKNKSN